MSLPCNVLVSTRLYMQSRPEGSSSSYLYAGCQRHPEERTAGKIVKPAVCNPSLLAAVELEDILPSKSAKGGLVYGAAAQQFLEDKLDQVWRELADVI